MIYDNITFIVFVEHNIRNKYSTHPSEKNAQYPPTQENHKEIRRQAVENSRKKNENRKLADSNRSSQKNGARESDPVFWGLSLKYVNIWKL